MAGFKLLALQAKLEEVCTLSRRLWLQYTAERGLPAQDLCSEEMMESVCVSAPPLTSLLSLMQGKQEEDAQGAQAQPFGLRSELRPRLHGIYVVRCFLEERSWQTTSHPH